MKFVLLTGLIHVGVLVVRSIKDRGWEYFNYFKILDLDAFFPKIATGWISDILSALLIMIFLGLFVFFELRKINEK